MKSVTRIITQLLVAVRKVKAFPAKPRRWQRGIFAALLLAAVLSSPMARSITPGNISGGAFWEPLSRTRLSPEDAVKCVTQIEPKLEGQYENYFGANLAERSMTPDQMAIKLSLLGIQTGKKPAVIWAIPQPEQLGLTLNTPSSKPVQLRLMLSTPGSKPVAWDIRSANPQALLQAVKRLRRAVANPRKINTNAYLQPAQQLYQWMVAPIADKLEAENIDTLLFCLGGGLRTLPLAALHDGEHFLVEKYNISRIPAFNLIETDYDQIKKSPVLAMGASEFTDLNPLPAVPVELETIAQELGQGKFFLNRTFTLENLKAQLASQDYKIVHLATHAEFKPGAPSNSFIQFWDSKLSLAQMRSLDWNRRPVELLVISACQTAVGDKDVELGFAGLALQAGVKSAIASLWQVSDAGTLALMTEFYQHLQTAPIKAEALRQAQIAMIEGKVRLEGGELQGSNRGLSLPPALVRLGKENLGHPYYWAAFTMISSPW